MAKKKTPTPVSVAQSVPQQTVFEKVYFFFFLLLPLIYSTKTVDPVLVPRQLFLSAFLIVLSVILWREISRKRMEPELSFFKTPLVLASLLLVTCCAISAGAADVVSESIYVCSKWTTETVFFLVTTMLLINGQLRWQTVTRMILWPVLILLLMAVYQLLQILGEEGDFAKSVYSVYATIAHKNLFASLLFLSSPFLLIGIVQRDTFRKLGLILLLLAFVLVWIIQARAVLIAWIVAATVYGLLVWRYRLVEISASRKRLIATVVVAVVLCTGGLTYLNRQAFSHLFYSESVYERLALWHNTTTVISEHPVTGVGAGNWQVHFPEHGLGRFNMGEVRSGMTTFQRPHNDFLWVTAETGIPGGIIYVFLFVAAVWMAWSNLRRAEEVRDKKIQAILAAAVCGYIVIAALDFPLERIEHQLYLYLIAGCITASYVRNRTQQKPQNNRNVRMLIVGSAALVSGGLIVSAYRFSGELHTQRMYTAHHAADWSTMMDEAEQASNPFYQLDPTTTPLTWYQGVALFSQDHIPEAKNRFMEALKLHPYNIHVLNNLASCYEKEGDHRTAIHYYRKALSYSPGFEEALLNLSAVYFNTGAYQKAYTTINLCLPECKDPKYASFLPAILMKKVIADCSGKEVILPDSRQLSVGYQQVRKQHKLPVYNCKHNRFE